MEKRVGDAGHEPAPLSAPPGPLTRFSSALAAPSSVLLIVPGLVVMAGLILSFLAQQSLRDSNLDVARARLDDQAQAVARTVRLALAQADPMLDRLGGLVRGHDPGRPLGPFAHALADLMQGRPGVTYISASFPDGTFQGVYSDAAGRLQFQDSRVQSDGTYVRRFALAGRDALRALREERTQYDPRQREFYRVAVSAGRRVWTRPYPFFSTHTTGITRTEPIHVVDAQNQQSGTSKLHAVLTVDYDVNAMSSMLEGRGLSGIRAVLYAREGTVLAVAGGALAHMPARVREDRTLRFTDLADPALRAFAEAAARRGGYPAAGMSRLLVRDTPFLSVVAKASADPALDWSVAYLAPESEFLKELVRYQRSSLWASFGVLVVAVLMAHLFARHITRARREVEAARAEVERARDQARELGSYRLVECLGKGGMGEVWRAEHRLLAREAAIKLINPSARSGSEELKVRFRREAQALAALRSRHTIELFDYGVADDGTFFFVMELLHGVDLERLVEQHGPQPYARVIPLLIQVCASLGEAHEAGLVHRDIKPANIFVCRAADELDVVKVLDFGLVRAALGPDEQPDAGLSAGSVRNLGAAEDKLTMAGAMGTPGFMAPEQALGRPLDGRADLYALGCVAFWLLSGRMVFEVSDPVQRVLAPLTEELPDLRARLPRDVPEELVALIVACLQRSPDARPSSARALALSLRAVAVADSGGAWSEQHLVRWWQQQPS
jgi:hypothetical protein